ncbi:MAG: ABC transporter permease [Armatimonadetes bacterium]|nr:ABC transporter permease [Armatimonadota bacterium]
MALLLALLVAGVSLHRPGFLSPQNLRDILQNAAHPMVAAAGMTALIVAGGIDISVGSALAVCAVVAGNLAKAGWPLPAVGAAAVGTGAVLGALNGFLVAVLRIPPIVATLATMGGLRGAMTWVTRGFWIHDLPPSYTRFGREIWLGIPATAWIAFATTLAVALYLAATRPGRQCYAVGSSPRAAALAGIRPERVLFRSFVLLGALVGLGSLLFTVRFDFIQENPGQGFELVVITAVVVGGTNIFGGRGTALGSTLGVLLLATIPPGLAYLQPVTGLRAHWEPAVQGVLILVAVLWDSLSRRADER